MSSASRRIAFGTLARLVGEAVGKAASLVFFIVVARELGEEQFGDFMFGMALSSVLLIVAGFGMQELVGREVAKDARNADDLVWNVIVIKAVTMVAVLVVIGGIVAAQGRSLEAAAAILIVSVGIGFEYQAGTLYAVFNGRERQEYVATTLIVNRLSTALMGIGAAVAGASLVTIAILFAVGSALGVVTAYWLMHRYVLQPGVRIRPRELAGADRQEPAAGDPGAARHRLVPHQRRPARPVRRRQRRRRRVRRRLPADRGVDVHRHRLQRRHARLVLAPDRRRPDRPRLRDGDQDRADAHAPGGARAGAVRRAGHRGPLRPGVRAAPSRRCGCSARWGSCGP